MLIRLTAPIFLFCVIFGVLAGSSDQVHAQALTAEDQKLDCPGVRAAVADVAVLIKRSEAQVGKETAAPPATLAEMFRSAAPSANATQLKNLRVRSAALATLSGTKGCNRLDAMAKSRLGGAIVKPDKPIAERCDVRGELSLQDCAEDVA